MADVIDPTPTSIMSSTPSPDIQIQRGDPGTPSVRTLLRRSEEYAYSLYPADGVHMLPVEELASAHVRFLVARRTSDGEPVGCGAVVVQPAGQAEIKRMFVDAGARRQGVGVAILRALEQEALGAGCTHLLLETGPEQPQAIALYRQEGFFIRGPFGSYQEDPHSVFMEKVLS